MSCPECGHPILVRDDLAVCTNCGTLADQPVLVDHGDHGTTHHGPPRTSKGWHLAQTKQDRDRRNQIAMSTFIASVLSRLNNPGLSSRAEAIFTQAMAKGHYRWGRKAKLTAGASIAIALREARKSDPLHDIAFLLDETHLSLSRTFRSITSLLHFSLDSTDPAVHLPLLHAHLQSTIHPETGPCNLPTALVSILKTLSLHVAVHTATSLSQTISHHSPPLPLTSLPTPPTACGLLILGLEAETRAPLPHLGELARTLASRFALAPGVVSSRYKILYNLIEEWIRHVPWLDHFVDKRSGRSKRPKRSVVAKGIKDVVQFQQEIWSSRVQSQQKIKLNLELDPSDVEEDGVDAPSVERRKAKKGGDVIEAAYRFMLDPLSSGSLREATSGGDVSLLSHILTCPSDELYRARSAPPTRLQLLTTSRGGSTAEHIADDELFVDGELEGLLRTEQERVALQPLFELNWGEESAKGKAAAPNQKSIEMKRGAKRINMDALARLLGGNTDGDSTNEDDAAEIPDRGDEAYLRSCDDDTLRGHETTAEGAELVGDWRPATPDNSDDDMFGMFYISADDRYDEEL